MENMQQPNQNLELQVGVAKVTKYAMTESGDTLEMVERPHGGLSVVLVDGQQSGRAAKLISNLVSRKAISLLGEGVRDGAVARAAHDYLRTHRLGKVSAELIIVSLDLITRTLVVSRNSHCPVIIVDAGGLHVLDQPSEAVGIYARTKPVITELPIAAHTWIVAFTDGISDAGRNSNVRADPATIVPSLLNDSVVGAQTVADGVLASAMQLDQGRPQDDMSVLVVAVLPCSSHDSARRLTARFPIPAF